MKAIKLVGGMIIVMVATTATAQKYFSVTEAGGNRYWSEVSGWQAPTGLPTASDDAELNSKDIPPKNPLVITNGTDAVCKNLVIANSPWANFVIDGRIPSLHISGGSLKSEGLYVGHHTNGYGVLTLSGGMLTNNSMSVGYNGIGVVTNNGGTVKASSLWIGHAGSGRGTYVQSSGTFAGGMTIGHSGTGTLVMAGGSISSSSDLFVGRNASSSGLLEIRAAGFELGTFGTLLVGYLGKGVLEQRANISSGYFKVGGSTNVTSVATIYEGATNHVQESCNIGGYRMWEGDGLKEKPGKGTLRLEGGVLKILSGTLAERLYVGQMAAGNGRIEGWGKVAPSSANANSIRMLLGNGAIEADGEGEMRTLDLNEVVSITNNIPNGADGNSGWYAVNKGCVLYPRTWFASSVSPVTCCFGDWSKKTAPGLVNSLRATFTGITSDTNHLRGGLYAPDREDIPSGLPVGATVGVWQLGLYNTITDWTGQATPFTDVSLTFRYDQSRVKNHQSLTLYRHTGAEWVKVGGSSVTPDHCITTTEPVSRLSGADANIGWFALVARDSGTVIVVK